MPSPLVNSRVAILLTLARHGEVRLGELPGLFSKLTEGKCSISQSTITSEVAHLLKDELIYERWDTNVVAKKGGMPRRHIRLSGFGEREAAAFQVALRKLSGG